MRQYESQQMSPGFTNMRLRVPTFRRVAFFSVHGMWWRHDGEVVTAISVSTVDWLKRLVKIMDGYDAS